MNDTSSFIDEMVTELIAIRDGRCVWCAMERPHPGYSQCYRAKCHGHDHGDHEHRQVRVTATHVMEAA